MKNILEINTKQNHYNIEYTYSFDELVDILEPIGIKERNVCIISDSNVADLYINTVIKQLDKVSKKIITYIFEAGESSKNLDTINEIYKLLIEEKFDRKCLLIALGGGVTGDMTGYAAATYLRGVDFVQIPTSLLSQVDSSIGGKTGVDFEGYKNMVGAFYQPQKVIININTLKTLPKNEFASGMAEIIKHGCIKDKDLLVFINDNYNEIMDLDLQVLQKLIFKSCLIKKDVVEKDEKENNIRALLNFGHTIGHAIEKLKDFTLLHGECVGVGMIASSYLSYKRGFITLEDLTYIESIISKCLLPTKVIDIRIQEIIQATKSDKKVKGNILHFILLKSVGEASIFTDLTEEELKDCIQYIIK